MQWLISGYKPQIIIHSFILKQMFSNLSIQYLMEKEDSYINH